MRSQTSTGWLALAVPLVLLAVEVALLTLSVEYVGGPMEWVAHPQVVQALMIAAVLVLMLRGAALANIAMLGHWWARLGWLAINAITFELLYRHSVWLARMSPASQEASAVGVLMWVGLALAVGASALLVGASWGTLMQWTTLAWHEAVGAIVLGAVAALLTRDIRQLWHVLWPTTMNISHRLLDWLHPEQALLYVSRSGNPVLGLRGRLFLEVTPSCAEIESLAVFLLLSGTLLVACWPVRLMRWIAATAVGLALLYLVNAVRLALLVEVGLRHGDKASVHLAHSRFSGMLFLLLGAAWLVTTRRWWGRAKIDPPVAAGAGG